MPRMTASLEPTDEWLTIVETAKLLRVGKNTVRAAIDRGEIPVMRFGRTVRVPRSSLAARALEERSGTGGTGAP